MTDFEDPRQFFKCSRSDCEADRAGGTPLCARHLREQEKAAGATSISEPELEARLRTIVTEDDMHQGEKKIWHDDGTSEWVPDPDYQSPGERYAGPDPDVNGVLRLDVPTWNQRVGNPQSSPPDGMVPVYDEQLRKWVLEPQEKPVDLERVRGLVKALAVEFGV